MFSAPLWCLLFGTAICLAVQDDSSDAKQKEMKEALGKAILKMLGLKHPPKVRKGLKEKIPQFILDAYNRQVDESEEEGDISVRTMSNRSCERRDFNVNFDEIYGGNLVVAPTSYNAYSCQGICPYPLSDSFNATNHAIIQTLQNVINSSVVPPACCVPTTLRPLSIIYNDGDGNPVLKLMDNMIVDACGCR